MLLGGHLLLLLGLKLLPLLLSVLLYTNDAALASGFASAGEPLPAFNAGKYLLLAQL